MVHVRTSGERRSITGNHIPNRCFGGEKCGLPGISLIAEDSFWLRCLPPLLRILALPDLNDYAEDDYDHRDQSRALRAPLLLCGDYFNGGATFLNAAGQRSEAIDLRRRGFAICRRQARAFLDPGRSVTSPSRSIVRNDLIEAERVELLLLALIEPPLHRSPRADLYLNTRESAFNDFSKGLLPQNCHERAPPQTTSGIQKPVKGCLSMDLSYDGR